MTFALTKVRAYGIEAEEVVNKRYLQFLVLNITAANTDVDLDIGDHVSGSLGTFWDAVDGSEPGDTALAAIRDIAARAEAYLWAHGIGLQQNVFYLDSAAAAGGAAAEAYTVTGLLATDEVLAITQQTANANAVYLKSFGSPGADSLTVTYSGDPGSGGKVRVLVKRGGYTEVLGTKAPNMTFLSGAAPTAYTVTLCWQLKDGEQPVSVYAEA